jgi:MoaA/NifB/PqqE/SkfB family radical SAM enzyme
MRCIHCDLWKTRRRHEELDTAAWLRIIDELADWPPIRHVHFTGGEPLLRSDFVTVVHHAARVRGLCVSANTSGALITERRARELIDSGINGLVFSIDGDDSLHGQIRGRPRIYGSNLKWMELFRQRFYVTIATVIMKKNLHQLPELVDFAVRVGAAGIGFQPLFQNFGQDRDERWFETNPNWPNDPIAVDAALDQLIAKKQAGFPVLNTAKHLELMKEYFRSPARLPGYKCLVGETNLAISPYGEVRLCYQMDPIGNVRGSHLHSIWSGPAAVALRSVIDRCQRSCSIMNCNYNDV